jgi:hypothetical protein
MTMENQKKYPYKVLSGDMLRRLDRCLKTKGGYYGQTTYRGKRYAVLEQLMSEKEAKTLAKQIRDYSPYGAVAIRGEIKYGWAVGIRQWK